MRLGSTQFIRTCAEEPFRIFFPLGLTIGCIGVSLWPLFFLGTTQAYPSVAHARLMTEGMMACFLFGFLGTAGPRVMSVRHFSEREVWLLVAVVGLSTAAHLLRFHAVGDAIFLLAL